ncbi:MAG: type ISP restriction/modification enzyme [Devosia sp.]
MPGRTWVIAPDSETLAARWGQLVNEKDPQRKETLFHPHEGGDRTLQKKLSDGLSGHEYRATAVGIDHKSVVAPTRYAFRSLDRQWIVPDKRLINRPNPALWDWHSSVQVYLTAPDDRSPTSGPAISFADLIPDLHHYNGRGGRVFPLWADASQTNVAALPRAAVADATNLTVSGEEMVAYLAAVLAHPAFTSHFAGDLVQPGLRVPLTSDRDLFQEAVALGREVIWLHTYGDRFADPLTGRPTGPPRMTKGEAPTIPAEGAIPGAPEPLPEAMRYDATKHRLHVGYGYVDNVTPEMWAYDVSGKQVVWQWFSYRKRNRTRPIIGDRRPPSPLDTIQPDYWLPEYTTDLINLLNVLGRLVALEPKQADLLERILAHPLITVANLKPAAENTDDS